MLATAVISILLLPVRLSYCFDTSKNLCTPRGRNLNGVFRCVTEVIMPSSHLFLFVILDNFHSNTVWTLPKCGDALWWWCPYLSSC